MPQGVVVAMEKYGICFFALTIGGYETGLASNCGSVKDHLDQLCQA